MIHHMESHVPNLGLIIVFREWAHKASTLPLDSSLKHGLQATSISLEKAFGFTARYLSENHALYKKKGGSGEEPHNIELSFIAAFKNRNQILPLH